MASMNPLGNKVPGFDFLQGLAKSAGAALPDLGDLRALLFLQGIARRDFIST